MTDKPSVIAVRPENIPQELKSIGRWLLWKYTPKKNAAGEITWTKVPKMPSGAGASSTDPSTWCSYGDAIDAYILGGFDGIGVVLDENDLHGIDLDDCRDTESGKLSDLAQRVLQQVEGYAEVSPSGTGIKIFTMTNLDGSRTKKEVGVELYRSGRYFAVTGHQLNGHEHLPQTEQDLNWLVHEVWSEQLGEVTVLEGDAADRALALYKAPLEGWDLDRVVQEVLPHLDPDCGYGEWLDVGQALHHQGQGDHEWLAAWDEWSAQSSKYIEGEPERKWRSFKPQRAFGHGAITLASLLKKTKDARGVVVAQKKQQTTDDLLFDIELTMELRELQDKVAARVADNNELSDIDRETVAAAIQARAKELGVKLPIGTVRGWCRPKYDADFPQLRADGSPLCTLDNFRVLMRRLNVTIRYNVIKKSVDVLMPGLVFTRDNRDNVSIAHVLSECEKVRMPTKHALQFLVTVADENQYNPVLNWIESRPWDGVSRLEAFFDTVRSSAPLKTKLMRKWLIQCVAAAASPDGIANQGILTFVGPQNIGKTTWFQRLAPEELDVIYTGHTLDLKSKDSIFTAVSHWIVELGEVDATMRKSDISALKSFITQIIDKLRRPYAPTESHYPRRTSFGASVNEEGYLHDHTGNRRFWSIPVEGFVLDHDIDMQQLWAEVLTLWKDGERWYLDQDEVRELNAHNEEFTAGDPVEDRLASGFAWGPDVQGWEWVTATEALIRVGFKEPNRSQSTKAGTVLRKLNGNQRRKSNGVALLAIPGQLEDFLQ